MSSDRITEDEHGIPIMLATRAPGQVAMQRSSGVVIRRGARSGNPNADTGSGRFTSKDGQPAQEPVVVQQTALPQGVTQEAWERRKDAVRDAAREMDEMGEGDAKEFLKSRPNITASKVDIAAFLADVREARLDDLVDVLDSQLRSSVSGTKRSRQFVQLRAPRSWPKRVFAGLSDEEVIKVVKRLEGKGWDSKDLTDNVIKKVNNKERKAKLEQLYGESQSKRKKKT